MIHWLSEQPNFPALDRALSSPNGLLAVGGDLTPNRLLAAYRNGIFPWYSEEQPILWWSPDPRMVLYVAEFRASRSLRRTVRTKRYRISMDTCFADVIGNCARVPRAGQSGTWITSAMRAAYNELHRLGFAHSVEAWNGGELVGGLYGLALGQVFFGESMFALEADASKVALVALISELRRRGIELIDCQQETTHLASFGARPITRAQFAKELRLLVDSPGSTLSWSRGDVEVAL